MPFNRKQKNRIRQISLTPLIDVVFLLLIFFMLSSTFLKFSKISVTAGPNGEGGATDKATISILRFGDNDVLLIDGRPISHSKLIETLNGLKQSGKTKLVIKPRDGITVQHILGVLERSKRSTLKDIVLVREE